MLHAPNVRLAPGINRSFSSCHLQDFQTIFIPTRKSSQENVAFPFLIVFIFGTFFQHVLLSSFFISLLQLISSCKESELKVILTSDTIILFFVYRRRCVYRQTRITLLYISDKHSFEQQ